MIKSKGLFEIFKVVSTLFGLLFFGFISLGCLTIKWWDPVYFRFINSVHQSPVFDAGGFVSMAVFAFIGFLQYSVKSVFVLLFKKSGHVDGGDHK